jgi:hypothetical protein
MKLLPMTEIKGGERNGSAEVPSLDLEGHCRLSRNVEQRRAGLPAVKEKRIRRECRKLSGLPR